MIEAGDVVCYHTPFKGYEVAVVRKKTGKFLTLDSETGTIHTEEQYVSELPPYVLEPHPMNGITEAMEETEEWWSA